jgi:DNA-binding NarL/FixJ family response regulator
VTTRERHTVLIVDDHELLLEGLRTLLGQYPDVEVVGAATTATDAVEKVAELHPDVVLMDYRLRDGDGASATAAIRSKDADVAVVFLSADDSESALFAAVEAGAVGYLDKSNSTVEVIDAVRRAAAGEMLLPQEVLARLIQHQRQRALDRRKREHLLGELTPRELEILRLMGAGLDTQEIAGRLFISQQTVRGHVRNVLGKLDCHTRLAAVARGGEYGLLENLSSASAEDKK